MMRLRRCHSMIFVRSARYPLWAASRNHIVVSDARITSIHFPVLCYFAVFASSCLIGHGNSVSDSGFRQTLEVRTLGCTRRYLSLPGSRSQRSQGQARRTKRTRDTRVYTGLGHLYGVIPYSSLVWWIAL